MGKQANGHDDNVILFPGLVPRLVDKGMISLKEKKYYDALTYFKQSIELEPEHPQARYGLVITNIELNRLAEARIHCESMLHEGIGDYYDVLQVYVSLLVQLGDYQEVVKLLEVVIAEDKLPAKMAESFYHLLEFSRQMTEGYESVEVETENGGDDSLELVPTTEELIQILEKGNLDQQWGAIQQLSQHDSLKVEKAYRSFLKGRDNNPVLKSYLLQTLKEMNSQGTFDVHKFGKDFIVTIEDLEDVFHEKFGTSVISKLETTLAQKNPSLFEMVQQVWWHYLFALFPESPEPLDINIWACALHHMGRNLLEEDTRIEEILILYQVEEEDVKKAVDHLKQIETLLFSMDHNEN
ncbi:tetratricopeptide repeat protein [Salipaludibacillus agaradhaerens]|uniref:Tetratricopeptide repeat protein n=1 Tax=Salipaludibacillus agaradhaerens TaxID=76935 RepID=A0A9Q4AZY6_SALAG|nr:tetratricopeptide repeat protein [Salipaludibacillus agaradhaerens]MCR6095630.1 tetratricopeptide repeat protein [Salipaludibacillus agaradhaerens]MCR6114810.1 tetratricopeptide repeat protein [Salipaludibacillus agaradhaerens]